MKYPVIDSREIVPVRLIPLITSEHSWLGRESIAGILANKVNIGGWPYPSAHAQFKVSVSAEASECDDLTTITRTSLDGLNQYDNGVHAYHLNKGGTPVKMLSSEWEVIYRLVSIQEPIQRKKEKKLGVPGSRESVWMLNTIKELPSGVFLWRDDLEMLWEDHIGTFTKNITYDPPGFRVMNHDAYVSPKYSKLVWEGFDHLILSNNIVTHPPSSLPFLALEEKPPSEVRENISGLEQSNIKPDRLLFLPQGLGKYAEDEIDIPIVEFAATTEMVQRASKPNFDLTAYVDECRKTGKKEEQIVYELMRDYGQSKKYSNPNTVRLSALAIGIAVFPRRGFKDAHEKDALERYVWTKVSAFHEKVT